MVIRFMAAVAIGLTIALGALASHSESSVPLTNHVIHFPVIKGEVEGPKDNGEATPLPEPQDTPTMPAMTTATPKPTATDSPANTPVPTSTPPPTATATRTFTPSPTATSKPTNTPKPTATPKPTNTPRPTPTPVPTAASTALPTPNAANVNCRSYANAQICAWVSNSSPTQNSNVTTYGRLIVNGSPVSQAPMYTTWHYKSYPSFENCVTNRNGIGECTRKIGRATIGYEVRVDVRIDHAGTQYETHTSFTPQ